MSVAAVIAGGGPLVCMGAYIPQIASKRLLSEPRMDADLLREVLSNKDLLTQAIQDAKEIVSAAWEDTKNAIAERNRKDIGTVVDVLKKCEQPEMPVTHRFSPGIYCREIFMPALPGGGTLVVGHVHKTRHQNIVLTGKAVVTIGEGRLEIVAPFVFESEAGAQKLLHIIEDMRWLTVHANPDNITDIPTIENMIFDLPPEIQEAGIPLDDFRMQRNLALKGEKP